ncbi:MAG TPA: sulfurtransferase [Oligoflexia bacterium]|nr:sulfurtransferase [Oligoflexia bacterium]HMP26738.1 sulfurtransferase [Oligoflexia bacterium]
MNSEILVDCDWVQERLNDSKVILVESNEDLLQYKSGHIKGAIEIDWVRDLNNQLIRDYLDGNHFANVCSRFGIKRDSTLVFYGDKHNWWACFAFWVFKLFSHPDCRILNGGKLAWQKKKLPLTSEVEDRKVTSYPVVQRDDKTDRILRDELLSKIRDQADCHLIDVRSADEFSGKRLHMEGYPNEGALRGGHIPGALNVPWGRAVDQETGLFKSVEQLKEIYFKECKLQVDREVIAYCRIGERSSHTWFVLKYLLGFKNVRNYDGSWTEWGNLVGAPIERF